MKQAIATNSSPGRNRTPASRAAFVEAGVEALVDAYRDPFADPLTELLPITLGLIQESDIPGETRGDLLERFDRMRATRGATEVHE